MTSQELFAKIEKSPLLVAYFSYPECSVCRVLRPKVEALVSEFPGVEFQYIDTHLHPEVSGQFLVFAVPTLIILGDGREYKRFSRHFSLNDLGGYLERLVALAREEE